MAIVRRRMVSPPPMMMMMSLDVTLVSGTTAMVSLFGMLVV